LGLSEAQKTQRAVQDILDTISNPRVTETMTTDIEARVSKQIELIENAIAQAGNMDSVANKFVHNLENITAIET
jgi:hypothetical protein